MHLSENEGIEGKIFVVAGGLGFVGAALSLELIRRGAREVRAFDRRDESPWSDDLRRQGVRCIQGNVSKKQDVDEALSGADCVFHLASYGMSGKEMLQYGRIDEVNINGTCHILDACLENGVRRLVYVSTYNVVFGGKEIVNGNESLPYFPIDDHVDPYARSKSIAEQLVLKSNGRPFKDKTGRLYSCAVRPAAIYGPGEERHFPRIIKLAESGLMLFKIGSPDVKSDWVYVDNLVLALLLASMGLLDDIPGRVGNPVAAGQAYFISDGSPVNSFEFLRPLFKSFDYDLPKLSLSTPHALLIGRFFWVLYSIMYPWLDRRWLPQPLILPAEVYKVGVTHYFSFLKAREELGYRPLIDPRDGMAATIEYWKDRERLGVEKPNILIRVGIIAGMLHLFCATFLPNFGPVPLLRAIALFFLWSLTVARVVLVAAVAAHVGEGVYAWGVAKRVDPENAGGWGWQTFLYGYPSLRLLLKRSANAAAAKSTI
ncbi:uncharacterized protein LOC127242610 [Andrographis paniculata]|uniref:uncharacterized protein LOC127242610 n=1 Tax=Andrographis paniculata TaxID=175694 RepID=UPI0021E724EB|nr:uncharacterized protein LOC127242610 [Andrographis paniculata]